MLLKGQGIVVNISSDAAINPYPKWGGYAISKASIDHMSRIFDEELKDQGVRFFSIDPGDMKTPMHFSAIPDANPDNLRDPADSAHKILRLVAQRDFSKVRLSV
jgi:NAD(P)-dependent dehydrogenase (short-subunit alcohol dehydrogenase family)